jgi:hypothetical protein
MLAALCILLLHVCTHSFFCLSIESFPQLLVENRYLVVIEKQALHITSCAELSIHVLFYLWIWYLLIYTLCDP